MQITSLIQIRWTVARKIGGIVLLLLALLAAISVYSIFQFRSLGRDVDAIIDRDFAIASDVSGIGLKSKDRLQVIREMVSLAVDKREHDLNQKNVELGQITGDIEARISRIRGLVTVDSAGAESSVLPVYSDLIILLEDLEIQAAEFELIAVDLFTNLENDKVGTSIGQFDQLQKLSAQVNVFIDDLSIEISQSSKASQTAISELEDTSVRLITLISMLAVILAASLSVLTTMKLRRALGVVSSRARVIEQTVSRDNFVHTEIETQTDDEIGDLTEALNLMSLSLAQTLEAHRTAQAELVEARDLAAEADRAKSMFLASMSHELRTPLHAIIGYSQLLNEEAIDSGDESTIQDLGRINQAGRVLLAMINDVLDISKIEAGRMEVYPEETEVGGIVKTVADLIQPLVSQNSNTLSVDVEQESTVINTDSTKVRQILFNLLSNAAKFTRDGRIELNARSADLDGFQHIEFRVVDTGIGMTDSEVNKIFDEFVQADSSTSAKYGGTGLGLSISKRFTEILGGQMSVESKKNEGTTFTVVLPTQYTGDAIGGEPQATPATSGRNA